MTQTVSDTEAKSCTCLARHAIARTKPKHVAAPTKPKHIIARTKPKHVAAPARERGSEEEREEIEKQSAGGQADSEAERIN